MNRNFLCSKLEAELTEPTLNSLINTHPHLTILFSLSYAYFSSSEPAVLMAIAQQLRNETYSELSKDFYEILAQSQEQISKVSAIIARISCKDDISTFFQNKVEKTYTIQTAENYQTSEQSEVIQISQNIKREEHYYVKEDNVAITKIQFSQMQTKRELIDVHETKQVQKIHQQFSENAEQEKLQLHTSVLANQTKMQAIRNNEQMLQCNFIQKQLQVDQSSPAIEKSEEEQDLLERSKTQDFNIATVSNQQKKIEQAERNCSFNQPTEKIEQVSHQSLGQKQLKNISSVPNVQIEFKGNFEICDVNQMERQKFSDLKKENTIKYLKSNKNYFIILFLVIWVVLLFYI